MSRGVVATCWVLLVIVGVNAPCGAQTYSTRDRASVASRSTSPRVESRGRVLLRSEQLENGFTVVIPGVLGRTPFNSSFVDTLERLPTAVEYYDWTQGIPFIHRQGLKSNESNLHHARTIARHIGGYHARFPDSPVNIVGLCAGCGIACEALAALPKDLRVDSVIFLAPALSPKYDLRPAIAQTKKGIHSFHSPLDVPVLVAFTTVFGTIDGRHTPAAGAIGFFRKPAGLQQHRYQPEMLSRGNWGGHFGWTAPEFVDKCLIPMLAHGARETSMARRTMAPRNR